MGILRMTFLHLGRDDLDDAPLDAQGGLGKMHALFGDQMDTFITCAGPRSRCGVTCLVRTTRPKLVISGKMYQLRSSRTNGRSTPR